MITSTKKPFSWVSAHRPIEYSFSYETFGVAGIFEADSLPVPTAPEEILGKISLLTNEPFSDTLEVGRLIYIDSGVYKGYHKILYIYLGVYIYLDTTFISEQFTGNASYITEHTFEIYCGYELGDIAEYLPFKKIAVFKPEPGPTGKLTFNISGYVNKIFDVLNSNARATIGGATVLYNLFNKIQLRLIVGSVSVWQHEVFAVNAAIDMYELNSKYVGTGNYLNGGILGNHFRTCGITENILIENTIVIVSPVVYNEGVQDNGGGGFETDSFSDGFDNTPNHG